MPSGTTAWVVDLGFVAGKRWQRQCPTKEDAEALEREKLAELRSDGEFGVSLTPMDRLEFAVAKERLSKVGATLTEAVDFFLKQARPALGPIMLRKMVLKCIEDKEEELGLQNRSVTQLKSVGLAFSRGENERRMAHEITAEDVLSWLRAGQWAEKTWNNYRGYVSQIFSWAISKGYVTKNPCDDVRQKRVVTDEIRFLSVDQVQSLFARASEVHGDIGGRQRSLTGHYAPVPIEEEDFRDFVPWLTLGFFCGPRPERELGELSTDQVRIDDDEAVLIIMGKSAKTRSRRTVDLSKNALAWWHAYPPSGKRIQPPNLQKRWKRLRQAVGLFEDWPHDGMRHTFATYHYAMHKNEDRLQALMGHEDATMLHAHYRGLATSKEAERFWALMPVHGTRVP